MKPKQQRTLLDLVIMYLSAIWNGFMLWISFTVHKYSPSNRFSILLETPRALTPHDFIVRAIPSFIACICLVIVAALLSRPYGARFSLLFRIINIKSDQFHHFYVQHIVWQQDR